MTSFQAIELVKTLERAYGVEMRKERREIYVRKLMKVTYERGHRGVEQCIEQEQRFPTVATILKHCLNVGMDGTPNALAYYTGPKRDDESERERNRRAIEHQERLIRMSDEEYEQYLFEYGRRMESKRARRRASGYYGEES